MFKREYKDYKIKLTMRSCVFYERLTGKSFFTFGLPGTTEEDALYLLYAMLIANNEIVLTFQSFKVLYGDSSFRKWIDGEFEEAMMFNSQFNKIEDDIDEDGEQEAEPLNPAKTTMTNVAAALIAANNITAEYVMNEMTLFEMQFYLKAIDTKEKARLVEQRLWTYLTIAPHIDCKKIKSPQKLLPFEFEKETIKQEYLDDLRKHKEEAKQIIGMDMNELFKPSVESTGNIVYLNPEDNPNNTVKIDVKQ